MHKNEYRIRPALAGYAWIKNGASLLKDNLVRWNVTLAIYLVLAIIASTMSLTFLAFHITGPVFWAGFYKAGEASSQLQQWTPAILFESLKTHARSLFVVGSIVTLINLAIAAIFMQHLETLIDLDALNVAIKTVAETGDKTAILQFFSDPLVVQQILLSVLIALLVSLPLVMAAWFAPVLVVKKSYGPYRALRESFQACRANFLSFFIYSVVVFVLLLLIIISFYIGILFIGPLILASYYSSYNDIWPDEDIENHTSPHFFKDNNDDTDSTFTV